MTVTCRRSRKLPVAVLAISLACVTSDANGNFRNTGAFVDLLLMRHAESIDNRFPLQGPFGKVDPGLTELGRAQAAMVRAHLRVRTEPDLIISSCLLRAQETALLAFPTYIVNVAPNVCELGWGETWLRPASVPIPVEQQLQAVQTTLGESTANRLSFEWAPPQDKCGPPDWELFLEWLWRVEDVQELLMSRSSLRQRGVIIVVTHGAFLQRLLKQAGWNKGKIQHAAVYNVSLPIRSDAEGVEVGFSNFRIIGPVFSGFRGQATDLYWIIIVSVVGFIALSCITTGVTLMCARRRRAQQGRIAPIARLFDNDQLIEVPPI